VIEFNDLNALEEALKHHDVAVGAGRAGDDERRDYFAGCGDIGKRREIDATVRSAADRG